MKNLSLGLICAALCLVGAQLRAATNVVQIRDFYFTPTNLTINAGDTITWTNFSVGDHRHDCSSTNTAFLWSSGDMTNGQRYSIKFTNGGTFPYICAVHVLANMPSQRHLEQTGTVIVASANLPPSVSLTNPANNAKFRAPVNIPLQATASDPGGSVTNVQFFSGETFCGNSTSSPYNVVFSNAGAGNYVFTARAFDNQGASSTSAAVNVFVLTNALLTSPALLPNGQFTLTILGIAGQTYTTESSTNFTNWVAVTTNIAPANVFNITDSTSTNILRQFYRARQDL